MTLVDDIDEAGKTIYDSIKRGKIDKIWMSKKEADFIKETDPVLYERIKPHLVNLIEK